MQTTINLKTMLPALLLTAALSAAAQSRNCRATVNVSVQGIEGGACRWYAEALPLSPLGEDTRKDTLDMRNGRLSYAIESDTLFKVFLFPEEKLCRDTAGNSDNSHMSIEVFMEHGASQSVEAQYTPGYITYSVSGSPLSATYAERLSAFRKANSVRLKELSHSFMADSLDSAARERINEEYALIGEEHRQSDIEYARQHPDEQVAAAYLIENATDSLFCAEAERLSSAVRNGQFKPVIDGAEKLYKIEKSVRDNKNNVRLGVDAPAFSYTTIDGKQVSQDMFKGKKYLVLDFWGSWCAWCIRGVPKMREYRDKYAGRLEILGVNCNDKPEKMKAAIEKHNINWLHIVNNEASIDENMMIKYAVQAFPTKIVISPEGKIVNYTEGEEEAFYEEIDKLIK